MARASVPGQRPPLPGGQVRGTRLVPARRWPWLLLLLIPVALISRACDGRQGDLGPVPAPEGQRIDEPIDLCLVVDDSTSTLDSDPDAVRYEAARFAADFLARQSVTARPDQVCVVHFGEDAPFELTLPLTPVDRMGEIQAAIQVVTPLGGTNFVAAHERAAELLGPADAGRHRVVILFTDGVPSSGSGADPFAEISASLDGLPRYDTHLVALDQDGAFGDVADEWEGMGLGSITRLSDIDGRRLEHAFARILVDELGMEWGG